MSDEINPVSSDSNIVEEEINIISDAISGIPTPIKKNALKAFGQLCTAVIDIPVAHLEGIAKEKRAETQARVKIIDTGADQIAKQMNIEPQYAKVAVKKYGQKILREQVNLDNISECAAQELEFESSKVSNNHGSEPKDKEISDDWLNSFEKEACNKSSDEMQKLFGKILAGEIRKPSSYSIKTIKLISQLDNQAAKLFQIYCSLCISLQAGGNIIDARVVSLGGNAGSNSLQEYGLNFTGLNILQEYGLIISDYNSYMDYGMSISNVNKQVSLPLSYQGREFGLVPQDARTPIGELKLNGVALSMSGKELFNIIDIIPSDKYTTALIEYFQKQKLNMVKIGQSS